MNKNKIVLGVASTRREVFSREEAIRYKNLVLDKLKDFDVKVIDIEAVSYTHLDVYKRQKYDRLPSFRI